MSLQLFSDPASLSPPSAVRTDHAGGGFVLRHPEALQPYARCIGAWLEHWSATTPDAPAAPARNPAETPTSRRAGLSIKT